MEFDREEDLQTVLNCKDYKVIKDLSKASSPFHKHRIFLLLTDFGTTKTVDGLENNMLFPI